MTDNQKDVFREEAGELLSELETALLELEETPDNPELVAQVFRAMHTIKGSGAMFGFDNVAAFTHEVETVFDQVRNGRIPVTKNLVNLSLAARDHITSLLEAPQDEGIDQDRSQELVSAFRQLLPAEGPEVQVSPQGQPASEAPAAQVTYRVRLRVPRDIVLRGTRPDTLLVELAELGHCRVVAQTEAIPPLEEIEPESCYVFWDFILTTDQGENAIRDVFIFVEDDTELSIEIIDEEGQFDNDEGYKRLGEILVERGDLTPEALAQVLNAHKPIGQVLIETQGVHPDKVEAALQEQEVVRERRRQRQAQETATSVRVPAERLDYLVDMVGELVTVQARLSQAAATRQDAELTAIAEEVERLTAELRDSSLGMRMLPIGSTFSKFKRLVRDLSQELGKEIDLETSGAETELDKTVIEKLNDPLVHLIRNSIDHGIEMPEVRQVAGKPREGTVHLAAVHSGDSVIIEIRDDGKGLDRDAIRAKAIERGLLSEADDLPDSDLFQLIFAAGFSTAQNVTSVSGRGVGMDVVKRAIDALRGSIQIQSEKGRGTVIRVKIPLTLAIIESLLVKIEGDHYVLPLALVEECIELTRQEVADAHGRDLVRVRDQLVPYLPLRGWFAIEGERPDIEQVVITKVNGHRVGLVVDHVIGEHQTVIKSLGRMYRDVEGISGATILGDGTVALIMDVPHLVQGAELAERNATHAAGVC